MTRAGIKALVNQGTSNWDSHKPSLYRLIDTMIDIVEIGGPNHSRMTDKLRIKISQVLSFFDPQNTKSGVEVSIYIRAMIMFLRDELTKIFDNNPTLYGREVLRGLNQLKRLGFLEKRISEFSAKNSLNFIQVTRYYIFSLLIDYMELKKGQEKHLTSKIRKKTSSLRHVVLTELKLKSTSKLSSVYMSMVILSKKYSYQKSEKRFLHKVVLYTLLFDLLSHSSANFVASKVSQTLVDQVKTTLALAKKIQGSELELVKKLIFEKVSGKRLANFEFWKEILGDNEAPAIEGLSNLDESAGYANRNDSQKAAQNDRIRAKRGSVYSQHQLDLKSRLERIEKDRRARDRSSSLVFKNSLIFGGLTKSIEGSYQVYTEKKFKEKLAISGPQMTSTRIASRSTKKKIDSFQ